MNWSRVGTVLAVLALGGLVAGAVASLLGGGVLATQSGAFVLGVVVVVVAILSIAGTVAASRIRNPYW
jgi:fructose-specific phosphotransferase system IIC component